MPPRLVPTASSRALAESLVVAIAQRMPLSASERRVIAIAGESGSGKSLTAVSLAQALDARGVSATVIHQDDYFHFPPRTNHERRLADLRRVGPQEVDLESISRHVAEFRAGRDVGDAPVVDYPGNRFVSHRLPFATATVLIVEGTYALQLGDADVRVFLEATHVETAERRRARNRDIDAPVIGDILAIEHEIIAAQAQLAHVVIGADFTIRRGA